MSTLRPAPWSRGGQDGRRLPGDVVDTLLAVVLVLVAASALAGTFDSWGFLGAALLGALAGALPVLALRRLRRPGVLALPVAAVLVWLLTPFVALRSAPSGPWPTPATWALLGDVLVHGWKQLLTTLPPVAADGRLVALVTVVAAVGGLLGAGLALRTRNRFAPLAGPAVTLVACAALGVAGPGGIVGRGVLLALGGVVWASVRESRRRVTAGSHAGQGALAVGLLAASALVGTLLAPAVTPDGGDRTVLRGRVSAPLTITDDTSPLAGFRRLTPAHRLLADKPLLTVDGLPAGTPVRLAVLDDYSGTVWSAGAGEGQGSFLRLGSRVTAPAAGQPVRATVRVEPALLAVPGLRSFLPTAGQLTSVRFLGADAWARSDDVRYDPQSGTALVDGGLRAGDSFALTGVLAPTSAPDAVTAVPQPSVAAADSAVAARFVAAVPGAGSDRIGQLRAVAERLRTTGAYTDGAGADARYPAGHGVGRMTAFFDGPQPVGDDEQYASALALAAAQVGLPSRVVLVGTTATTAGGTVVRGRDVRAAVEVQTGPDRWWTIPARDFVPDPSRRPRPRVDRQQDRAERAVVPPPNAQRPPSATDQFILDSSSSARGRTPVAAATKSLPWWVTALVVALVAPLVALVLWAAVVAALKAVRRARRRRAAPAQAVDGAWRELVDVLVDHRVPVRRGRTRAQVAQATGMPAVVLLARQVDTASFGAEAPTADDATRVWERLDVVRAGLRVEQRPLDRLRGLLTVRSLLPDRAPYDEDARPSARYRSLVTPGRARLAASAHPTDGTPGRA